MLRKPVHEFESLSAYLDGQVSAAERLRIERHLADCAECTAELERLRQVVSVLRQCPPVRPTRSFTLSAEQVRARPPLPLFVRLSPYATALAALLLAIVVFADVAVLSPAMGHRALGAAAPPETLQRGVPAAATHGSAVPATTEPTVVALIAESVSENDVATGAAEAPAMAVGGQERAASPAGEGEAAADGAESGVGDEAEPLLGISAESFAEETVAADTQSLSSGALDALAAAPPAETATTPLYGSTPLATEPAIEYALANSTPAATEAPLLAKAVVSEGTAQSETTPPSVTALPSPVVQQAASTRPWWLWPLRASEVALVAALMVAAGTWARRGTTH